MKKFVMSNMNSVTVYAVNTETVRQTDAGILYRSMPERMKKARKYRREQDCLLCIGAGILLFDIVGIKDETVIRYNQYGKPHAPGYPDFNLSHSGEWCVIAVGHGDLGIDIEKIKSDNIKLAPAVCTPDEAEWLSKAPAERFHTLWTYKESLIKAAGTGMSIEPASVDVLPFCNDRPVTLMGRKWYARSLEITGYSLSVCSSARIGEVKFTEWKQRKIL